MSIFTDLRLLVGRAKKTFRAYSLALQHTCVFLLLLPFCFGSKAIYNYSSSNLHSILDRQRRNPKGRFDLQRVSFVLNFYFIQFFSKTLTYGNFQVMAKQLWANGQVDSDALKKELGEDNVELVSFGLNYLY